MDIKISKVPPPATSWDRFSRRDSHPSSPRARRAATAHHDARDDDENVDEIARGRARARSRGQAIDWTVRIPRTRVRYSTRRDHSTRDARIHSFARARALNRIRIARSYLDGIA